MTNFRLPVYRTTVAVLILVFAFAARTQGGDFFPLKDVHPGLTGIGKTVFNADKVEEFKVEILGVLENSGPKESIIMARLSGGPLEKTGVMQGMSGSPVYIDGKLLGAVALAFPFAKEPIAGIRPIEDMLRVMHGQPLPSVAGRVTLADQSLTEHVARAPNLSNEKLVNIATPLSVSGLTDGTVERFASELKALGFRPQQAITGGKAAPTEKPREPIQPGSMISVLLMSGDINIGADGTVTYIDGQKVYAFGHRFLASGPTEMPFARSSVIALLPNVSSSFKISATGDWLGTITADNNTAIAGEIGRPSRTVPCSITVRGERSTNVYRMKMISDPVLSPLLMQMSLYSALDETERTLGAGSIDLKGSIAFEGNVQPIRIDNMYGGDFNVPFQASLSAILPVAYALQNSATPLRLKSVDLELQVSTEKKQLQIEQMWTSKREVHPGESVEIYTLLSGAGRPELTKHVTYQVPIGAETGTLYFTAADGSTINALDYQQLASSQVRPAGELIDLLNHLRGSQKGYIRVWRAESAPQVNSLDMSNAPPSLALVLSRTQGSQNTSARVTRVADLDFTASGSMISGSKTVQVEIKE